MTEIQILYIIIFLMILCMGYLFYQINKKTSEHFDATTDAVNFQYKMDIDAIRNLGQISKKIMDNPDNLILPANISIPNQLNVKGKLTVEGDVVFTNKNNNIMELLPSYMIVALQLPPINSTGKTNIPKGWAICDGQRYSIGADGYALLDPNYGIQTPDLKGRFILGVGAGTGLTERKFDDPKGGEETHTLTVDEIPSHNHPNVLLKANNCFHGGSCSGDRDTVWNDDRTTNTGNIGGGKAHNNMPPYFVLTYIMKL